ncbi:MAG: SoxR reducing system RseC family protein [Oscillospiraceae bacterium]|nr:SoxR reducing system RseC family protein [Oscillospiraceae bacterium]
MTQIATVERVLDASHAMISVPRKSACGHDCAECAGCGVTGMAVRAKALNLIGAEPGQQVVVRSDTKSALRMIAVVYLIPVALFLIGYIVGAFLTERVPVQYAMAVCGFFLGLLPAILYDRRLKAVGGLSLTIVRVF